MSYFRFMSGCFVLCLAAASQGALAQNAPARHPAPNSGVTVAPSKQLDTVKSITRSATAETTASQRLNENTVTIVGGSLSSTYLVLASDMSIVLDGGEQLRVLPMIGKGGLQNVKDLLLLRGVDLGITQTDVLKTLKLTGEFGPNVSDKLVYITKLYDEEMHVLARNDIKELKDLNDKVVNFGQSGSSADLSARLIFKSLGITVQSINVAQADALVLLKSGKIAASVEISGKPMALFSALKQTDGLKFLPVPYIEALEADYIPAELSAAEYPGLIAANDTVETVSVGAVLVALNWPRNTDRYRRVARFVNSMFDNFAEFQKAPRHPKWTEVNLAASLPGWKRFPAAQEWVEGPASSAPPARSVAVMSATSAQPLPAPAMANPAPVPPAAKGAPAGADAAVSNDELFRQFQNWMRTRKQP